MCLDKITKVYKPNLFNLWIPKFAYKSGVGWKEFTKLRDDNLESMFKGDGTLPMNKFLDEKSYRYAPYYEEAELCIYDRDKEYSFGWHICLEMSDMFDSDNSVSINRVEFKYGHTLGIDKSYECPTIVAKYMKILD